MLQDLTEKEIQKILVIDDHESVLFGTSQILERQYPEAEISTAKNAQEALTQIAKIQPDVVVMDLSIPEKPGEIGKTDTGIQLLRNLMQKDKHLNITVQSAHIKTLLRIKPEIDAHQGGFTIADKSLPSQIMLKLVDLASQGFTHTKDIKSTRLEMKPVWLTVLKLACQEGWTDKAIAEEINVCERMVGHYWSKLQDALEVYPEKGKNIRIQIEKRARELGLID